VRLNVAVALFFFFIFVYIYIFFFLFPLPFIGVFVFLCHSLFSLFKGCAGHVESDERVAAAGAGRPPCPRRQRVVRDAMGRLLRRSLCREQGA
jgi:hypothetical protein